MAGPCGFTGTRRAPQAPSRSCLGRPLDFYLFTLPAWQLIAGWLLTLAIVSFNHGGLVPAGHGRRARVWAGG